MTHKHVDSLDHNVLTKEFLRYDLPAISEYISSDFLQEMLGRYVAWKVSRKIRRYNHRIAREKFLQEFSK